MLILYGWLTIWWYSTAYVLIVLWYVNSISISLVITKSRVICNEFLYINKYIFTTMCWTWYWANSLLSLYFFRRAREVLKKRQNSLNIEYHDVYWRTIDFGVILKFDNGTTLFLCKYANVSYYVNTVTALELLLTPSKVRVTNNLLCIFSIITACFFHYKSLFLQHFQVIFEHTWSLVVYFVRCSL